MATCSSPSSDFELETINPASDPVTFEDVQEHYEPHQDIFVIYSLGQSYIPSSRDWVGLFPASWTTTNQYVAFEWAPTLPRNAKFKDIRSVLFQAHNIQVESNETCRYQYLYVARDNHVVGVSKNFKIHNHIPNDLNWFTYDDYCIGGDIPLTVMEPPKPKSKGSLETFELIGSCSDSHLSSSSCETLFGNLFVHSSDTALHKPTSHPSSDTMFGNLVDEITINTKHSSDTFFGNLFDELEPIVAHMKDTKEGCWPVEHKSDELLKRQRDSSTLADIEDFGLKSIKVPKMDAGMLTMLPIVNDYYSTDNTNKALVPRGDRSVVCYKPIYSLDNAQHHKEDHLTPIATRYLAALSKTYTKHSEKDNKETAENLMEQQKLYLNHFFQLNSQTMEPAKPLIVPAFYKRMLDSKQNVKPKKTHKNKACRECKKRSAELKTLNIKTAIIEKKLKAFQEDFENQDEQLNMKNLLTNELSKQVKNLVAENGKLTAANDRLYTRKSDLDYLKRHNQQYLKELVHVKQQLGDLQDENLDLLHENGWLEHKLKISFGDKEAFQDVNGSLNDRLHELRDKYEGLESHLNDIMFTLSQKGYTRLIDTEGKTVELVGSRGKLIELQGWNIAMSKKTEKYMQCIADLENHVDRLKLDMDSLNKCITIKENEVKQMQTKIKTQRKEKLKLRSNLEDCTQKLSEISSKEKSLSKLLIEEKKRKGEVIRHHTRREQQLSAQVKSLQHALEAATLVAKQKEHKQTQSVAVMKKDAAVQPQPDVSKATKTPVAKQLPKAVEIFQSQAKPLQPEINKVPSWADIMDKHCENNHVASASCVIEIPEEEERVASPKQEKPAQSLKNIAQSVTQTAIQAAQSKAAGMMQAVCGTKPKKPAKPSRPFFRIYTGVGRGSSAKGHGNGAKVAAGSGKVITSQVKSTVKKAHNMAKEKCPHCCIIFPFNEDPAKIAQHIHMHEKYSRC